MVEIPSSELEKIIDTYGSFIKHFTNIINNFNLNENYIPLRDLGETLTENKFLKQHMPKTYHFIECCLIEAKEKYYS